jgi:NAD(P)-dependent dehydrogenase (short-subunit alcohol dehydrogenase family)
MDISGSVALVTGANRGLGRVLAGQLLDRGAKTVYAAARDPRSIADDRLVPVALDVTDPESIRRAVEAVGDVTLLVNNAGRAGAGSLLTADLDAVRAEMETNYLGPLRVIRAFAPVLARNGGGAVVDVLSVMSWLAAPSSGSYAASKAAAWSLTNSVRAELRGQGTLVIGAHMGYMDTDMTAHLDVDKIAPAGVASQILDAVAAGAEEVLADDVTRGVKQLLSGPPAGLVPSR